MNQDNRYRLAAAAVTLVLAIGLVDAAIGTDWDLFAVMAIALGLQAVVLSGTRPDRPAVPIRGDLVAWARERAQRGGRGSVRRAGRGGSRSARRPGGRGRWP